MISHDLNEMLALSDRVGVLFEGRLVKVVETASTNEEELGYLMTGGDDEN